MSAVFKYILDFKANTEKVTKEVGGMQGMLKGAAVAAGALFAVDKAIDAAKAVAAYAGEISKVRNEVEMLTGMQGKAASEMTGQVTALGKAYDQDLGGTLKAANTVMQSFGSSSREAFDLLNVGLSGAANSQGDLLQQISEYSPHFKEAGLAANEMFAVIAAGNKEGVFNDKAADAIKEGSIRLREMTQSTKDAINGLGLSSTEIQRAIADGSMTSFEAMQKVSNKLKEFPEQAPQVGAALADIFGGPGEDAVNFIRTLGDLDTSMEGLMAGATEAQKAQMRYTESLAEFHKVGATVFGGTGELMTKLKTVGMDMVNGLIKGVVSVINYFIDLYNESAVVRGAFETIGFAVKTVFGYVGTLFKDLLNKFQGIGKVIKAVFTGDFAAIGDIVKETFSNSAALAADFGKKTADNFSKGIQNTLNPREKVKLISFDAEATQAGTEAAKIFSQGFSKSLSTQPVRVESMTTLTTKTVLPQMGGGLDASVADIANQGLADMGAHMDELSLKAQQLQADFIGFGNVAIDLGAVALPAIQSGFSGLGESIGAALAGTAQAGDIFTSLMGIVGDFMNSLGQSMIATGTAGIAFQKLVTNPYLAVAAGVTLVALSSALKSMLSGGPAETAMANGGIVYGPTRALVGEYPGANSNPEVIAPLSKLKGMIGEQTGGGAMRVEVVGSISGDTIRLAQKRAERKSNQYN